MTEKEKDNEATKGRKKFQLNKQTIKDLGARETQHVKGGVPKNIPSRTNDKFDPMCE